MSFNYEYPYTDPHRHNDDWILARVKQLTQDWINTVNEWHGTKEDLMALKNYVTGFFENLDLQEEANIKIDNMAADGSLSKLIQPFVDAYKEELRNDIASIRNDMYDYIEVQNENIANFRGDMNARVDKQDNDISVLETRMNTLTAMPEGSTAGDAELMDARIDHRDKTHTNVGAHVRALGAELFGHFDVYFPDMIYDWTIGRGVNSEGVNEPLRYTAVTNLVTCTPGDKIYSYSLSRDGAGNDLNCRVSLYDESKNWISRHSIRDKELVIPSNARFYCITFGRGSESGISFTEDDLQYFSVKHVSEVATLDYVNTQLGIVDNPKYRLEANTDFNTITEFGRYSVSENMSTMINRPNTDTSGLLIVSRLHLKKRVIQCYISNTCEIFFRIKNTDTAWSRWRRLINNEESYSMANYTSDGVKILESVKKCLTQFTALSDVTTMFEANKTYTGLPYEDTHYFSRDAFFNYNLETVFSMFNNQDSVMYTHVDEDGRIFTGGVCSSFVGWILGLPIYYTTYDFLKMLNYKVINDLSDIEIGDVLITHTLLGNSEDHVAIVSNIFTDEDGVTAIEVAEAWSPLFRTVKYTANNFWSFLKKYRVGRFDNIQIRTIPPITINTDIISERGDNTYYEQGEQIFIKSENTVIQITDADGVNKIVDLSDSPKKGAMYDISSALNKVGKWTLHGMNDEESHITVIKKGNAVLSGTTLNLSGYEACKPCGYAVVVIRNDGKGSAYETHIDNPDFTASRLTIYSKEDPRYAGALSGDTLDINVSDIKDVHVGYYVRVFYDTGCGQAFKDSNIVFF